MSCQVLSKQLKILTREMGGRSRCFLFKDVLKKHPGKFSGRGRQQTMFFLVKEFPFQGRLFGFKGCRVNVTLDLDNFPHH